jgi:hypothetical protein
MEMAQGKVTHDVVQLLDKYPVTEILNALAENASDQSFGILKKWCAENLGVKVDAGDQIDTTVISGLIDDVDKLKKKIVRLEFIVDLHKQKSPPSGWGDSDWKGLFEEDRNE